MIYGTLSHLENYSGIQPLILKGLRYLAETDFSGMAPGRIAVGAPAPVCKCIVKARLV